MGGFYALLTSSTHRIGSKCAATTSVELSEDGQGEDRYEKIVYGQAKINRFFVNAFLKLNGPRPSGVTGRGSRAIVVAAR